MGASGIAYAIAPSPSRIPSGWGYSCQNIGCYPNDISSAQYIYTPIFNTSERKRLKVD
jgi:hypothetical protein